MSLSLINKNRLTAAMMLYMMLLFLLLVLIVVTVLVRSDNEESLNNVRVAQAPIVITVSVGDTPETEVEVVAEEKAVLLKKFDIAVPSSSEEISDIENIIEVTVAVVEKSK